MYGFINGGIYILNHVNVYVLLIISVLVTLIYTIFRNVFSKKHANSEADYFLFNAVSSIVSAVVLFAMAGGLSIPSAFTVLLGIGYGVLTIFSSITVLAALRIGPMSYTTLIVTFALIIPTLSGRLFWNETIGAWQYFGIALMLISIALSSEKKINQNGFSYRWLLLCMGAFISSGLIGVLQKLHQSSVHKRELNAFLIIAFIVSALFSYAAYWHFKRKQEKADKPQMRFSFPIGAMAVLSGICIALANLFNLYLAGVMDSAVFFPVVNGGGLILATITAAVFFKEKLSLKQRVGMVVGIISVLFICNII